MKVFATFHPKAKLWVEGRNGLLNQLNQYFQNNNSPVAWFHCASLGEFEQARPVIESFKTEFTEYKILLTFFSPSGFEIRKNYPLADFVCYLPIDTASNAKRFISITNPKVVFFTKYEFWYHYLTQLKLSQRIVISISSIFRPNQVFFKWYGGFYLSFLKCFDKIFVQNQASISLLYQHGLHSAVYAGDTRFDRVMALSNSPIGYEKIKKFKSNQQLFIGGSLWKEDVAVILPMLCQLKGLKIIIAPHEIEESFMKSIEANPYLKVIRYSKLTDNSAEDFDLLIIDNIGMLSNLYQYADYAFIGGGYGKGIHNTLEAASYGMPIFFGLNYTKFQEAKDMIAIGCAAAVSSSNDFQNKFSKLYGSDKTRALGMLSKQYVAENTGATEKIISYCKSVL
ncbi:MAG: 3-deoxy-D-manno-octulosonic acid transferase [Cytophagales bacterium]|nr:MAG: 3-deoxy-D-manno-octulosonic acid transferase [Cytophagales bacterium]